MFSDVNSIVFTGLAIVTLILIGLVIFDMWMRDSFTLETKEGDDNVGIDQSN